jgi:hypothetical protein
MMSSGKASWRRISVIAPLWVSLTVVVLAFAYYDCSDPDDLVQTLVANAAFMVLLLFFLLKWART